MQIDGPARVPRLTVSTAAPAANAKRRKKPRRLARLTAEQVSPATVMARPAIHAYRPGRVLKLTAYLPARADRFNDMRIGAGRQ